MKYIKLFEDINNGKYWLVPTDERFVDSLRMIGVDETYIKILDGESVHCGIKKREYAFIAYSTPSVLKYSRDDGIDWGWMPYEDVPTCWFYDAEGAKFMGVVNMDEDELERKDAIKKYNL